MNKLKIQLRKASRGNRGSGIVSWSQFEAILRAHNILMEGQHLESVEVSQKGIVYSTSKTGNQK